MLESLKKVFVGAGGARPPKGGGGKEDLRVATCALLLEAALANDEMSADEFQKIVEVLKDRFGLTDPAVNDLVETAKEEHARSTDLWSFAQQVNQALTREQKFEVMEMVWRVIYADGTMDQFEDYVAQRLHRLLRIDHKTFIALKLKVKSEMGD
ncbi:MAG: TerB family tellurite resistance protein [Nitrospinota bacterium]